MEDEQNQFTPDADITTPEDIRTEPPGNADTESDSVEKGKDKLDGTLPY